MDVRPWWHRHRLTVTAAVGTVVVLVALASLLLRGRPAWLLYELFVFHNAPSAIVLLWMGWLVLRHRPGHGAGRVLLAIGIFDAAHVGVAALEDARLVAAGIDLAVAPDTALVPAELPLGVAVLEMLLATLWVPPVVLLLTMLLLLFPDGSLPSPRWRWVPATAAAGTCVVLLGFVIVTWPTVGRDEPTIAGMLVDEALFVPGGVAIVVAVVASVVALVQRWRRTPSVERWPFRVVGAAAAALALVVVVTYPWWDIWVPATLIAGTLLVIVYALAVARYRLHDLEPVLGRTAVAAILAGLVAVVYLVIVVGVGSLVGRGVDNAVLPLVAVGVVALLIEPARRHARRLVDRLLYRRQADRTEVLSRLAERASASTDAEEILVEVADLLVRSTGASRAEVWLEIDRAEQLAASSGDSGEPSPVLRAAVVHQDERLGELRLYATAAADLVPDANQLLDDVAHSLGVVVRNARLTVQLRAQVDELQRSRQRLVEVHDQARRGLERDIHDGAQARLISLRLRLGAARAMAGDVASDAVREQLDQLGAEVDAAVRSLRELARGLHPPILEQSGLAAAIRAHVRDLPGPVSVDADGVGRYERAVEGAVYFSCLEAVQNAVRHSGAQLIVVSLSAEHDALRFRVSDDGRGFDPEQVIAGAGLANIGDRVAALGGHVRIESTPGRGALVAGEIPAQALVDDR